MKPAMLPINHVTAMNEINADDAPLVHATSTLSQLKNPWPMWIPLLSIRIKPPDNAVCTGRNRCSLSFFCNIFFLAHFIFAACHKTRAIETDGKIIFVFRRAKNM